MKTPETVPSIIARDFEMEVAKLEAQAEACRKILGYNDGDLLDNVTRYHAYATHEIKLLRALGESLVASYQKPQELLPEDAMRVVRPLVN